MLSFRVTPGSPTPLYQQITTHVRHAIVSGTVRPGDLLPSVRALAEQLLINPNTVAKAYAELSRDGLIETLPGKGVAIAPRRPGMGLTPAERRRRLDPGITQLVHDAIGLDLSLSDAVSLLTEKWNDVALAAQGALATA